MYSTLIYKIGKIRTTHTATRMSIPNPTTENTSITIRSKPNMLLQFPPNSNAIAIPPERLGAKSQSLTPKEGKRQRPI